ncbi:uncharacterized protein CTHT_0070470 [Thermochaetoides thermophila DSM 1495]|uniref:Uncharacterized protein n=1 Tax=Chaetomium thermophilum (strain DSM 1495 / CBS 144.50 / IMI 039719) TaxID=759272 RepID=G0SHL6_CHATD|nr:hypothetical protein CTHT_0070470 [Thermochaetoides thermophila DSM 1495]EGS17705.1 hypothetical protein CTHT_0070470 [Thermochaetoides thermophila DSM 1495]
MDAPTSPAKRRVLGELNPNAASPKACRRTDLKLAGASPTKQQLPRSPIKMKLAPPTIEQQNASPSRKLRQPQKQHMEAEESPKKRRSPSPVSQQAVTESSRQDAERDEVVEPPAKRPCLQQSAEGQQGAQESVKSQSPPPSSIPSTIIDTGRSRAASPESPSVFDATAANDTTVLTEPETAAAPAAPASAIAPAIAVPRIPDIPRPAPYIAAKSSYPVEKPQKPRLTREQCREKAEILRLRLGLASYKVRTGQTEVPLEQLEKKFLPTPQNQQSSSPRGHPHAHPHPQAWHPQAGSGQYRPPNTGGSSSFMVAATPKRTPLPEAPVRRNSVPYQYQGGYAQYHHQYQAHPAYVQHSRSHSSRLSHRPQPSRYYPRGESDPLPRITEESESRYGHLVPRRASYAGPASVSTPAPARAGSPSAGAAPQSEGVNIRRRDRLELLTDLGNSSSNNSSGSSSSSNSSSSSSESENEDEEFDEEGGAASGLLRLARGKLGV